MAVKVARSTNNHFVAKTCVYWLAGRCNRNPCRFMHRETPSPYTVHHNANTAYKYTRKPPSSAEKTPKYNSKAVLTRENEDSGDKKRSAEKTPKYNSKAVLTRKNGDAGDKTSLAKAPQKCNPKAVLTIENGDAGDKTSLDKAPEKPSTTICRYWVNDNCVHGDQCQNLHSWFYGDGCSSIANLQGHKKVVTGVALPVGSDNLYSASTDGTVRIWDCHTGQCVNVVNLGSEVTSLITEVPWIFVGVKNAVKAWNVQAGSELTLDGPKGQVLAMVVGNDTLFAGAEDGVITAWRGSSEATSPFAMVASLGGHTKAVVCLTVGRNMLYSGSMDHSIKVWDLDTLECKMALNGHTDAVTSLICWDHYLLSSSSDCTIKVWVATEEGTLKVIYTHTEEKGVVALSGMTDAEGKHILFCSCRDNSVCLYELPSFSERGRLFAKQEVRSIEMGPGGLFFTGDGTGLLKVWKWLEEPKVASN